MFISMDHQNPQTINIFSFNSTIRVYGGVSGCSKALLLAGDVCVYVCVYKFVMVFEIFPWGSQLRFSSCRCRRRCRRRHRHHHGGGNEAKGNSLRCAAVKCWSYELLSQGGNCSRSMRDLEDCWRLWRRRGGAVAAAADKKILLFRERKITDDLQRILLLSAFFPLFFQVLVYESSTIYINNL